MNAATQPKVIYVEPYDELLTIYADAERHVAAQLMGNGTITFDWALLEGMARDWEKNDENKRDCGIVIARMLVAARGA